MHSTFAFGLAKNGVNGLPSVRRAATASQISGRLSTPHSPESAKNNVTGWNSSEEEAVAVTSVSLALATPPPIAFIDRNSEDLAAGDAKTKMTLCGTGDDLHPRKRGTSVDKTNPFIGYFQTGTEDVEKEAVDSPLSIPPPMPRHCVSCRTQSSAALSSMSSFYPSAFFAPHKQKTEWLGSQSSHFTPFLKQQDAKERNQKQHMVFLESLKLETPALAMQAMTDEIQEKMKYKTSTKQTNARPAAMSTTAAFLPIVTSSSEMNISSTALRNEDSCALNSRFEQDFEVVGSVGEGGQGFVYKVRSKVDGCYYAIKKVVLPRATKLDARRVESQALREVCSMASMAPHPNVVRYHTAWTEVDAYVPDTNSSTKSVRGSDVPSLVESNNSPQDFQRQQLALLDEEAQLQRSSVKCDDEWFPLEFSADSLSFDECSTPGFTFEDEDKYLVGLYANEAPFGQQEILENEVEAASSSFAELAAVKAQVILYIQMELCGTAMNSVPSSPTAIDNHEPIYRILDKFKTPQQERQHVGEERHSNLGAWFRSSLEQRSSWSNKSEKYMEGLKLFFGAVQGVAHMHSYGVIHRDLKPDNIFIHGDAAKIGDFGLSKSVFADNSIDGAASPRERLQELGLSDGDHTTALGTFTYASPEQLGYRFSSSNALKNAATRLKSAKYSIKSDIFALGVILLELCCPFSTMMERSQVLTGVRHGVVPQKARQNFPMEMDLVLRMTSIDPGERPTSVEVCEQLRKIIAASSITTGPASALQELREIQTKLVAAVRLVRDRTHATLQLEALVSELNDKVRNVEIALA
ncbi:unnamed protein product [Peronospora farinosa]|uniref:Protein kinase domain-containing protein n=1 Tax=Peronospora farinosa TaxID=134698 RepID=A0AAV0TQG5_9STRA|nr:unnamed protein product [Peronospora farinosa]